MEKKRLLLIKGKQISQAKGYLVLFFVWGDTRVWAQGSHSFDMHLSFLGPAPCAFKSRVPQGLLWGVAAV